MKCPSCGAENPGGSKFCETCGSPLANGIAAAHPQKRWKKVLVAVAAVVAVAVVGVVAGGRLGLMQTEQSSGGATLVADSQGSSYGSYVSPSLWSGNDAAPYVAQDGTECGNTPSNYANGGYSVSDPDYDYFYSEKQGGLCRAKKGSSEVDVIVPASSFGGTKTMQVNQLNKDGDTLYFVIWTSEGYAICSAKTDGSNFSKLYSVTGYDTSTGADHLIRGFSLYDHALYFITESMPGSSGSAVNVYDVYTMNEDGSGQQKHSSFQLAGAAVPFLTKDKVYCIYDNPENDSKSSGRSSVLSQSLDGSGQQTIYTCTLAIINGAIIQDGSIYVMESGLANSASSDYGYQLVRMDASGGSQSVLLTGSVSGRMYVELAGISNGNAYVGEYGDGVLDSLKEVPLAGGDSSAVDVNFAGIGAKLMNACDCLLMYGMDTAGSYGARVARIGLDGTVYRQLVG